VPQTRAIGPNNLISLSSKSSRGCFLTSEIEDGSIQDDVATPAAHNHNLVCTYYEISILTPSVTYRVGCRLTSPEIVHPGNDQLKAPKFRIESYTPFELSNLSGRTEQRVVIGDDSLVTLNITPDFLVRRRLNLLLHHSGGWSKIAEFEDKSKFLTR
jgi:hypothetical protein